MNKGDISLCIRRSGNEEKVESDVHEVQRRHPPRLARKHLPDLVPIQQVNLDTFQSIVELILVITIRCFPPPLRPSPASRDPEEALQPREELVRVESVGVNLELSCFKGTGFGSGDENAGIEDGFGGGIDEFEETVGGGDLEREVVDTGVGEVAAGVCDGVEGEGDGQKRERKGREEKKDEPSTTPCNCLYLNLRFFFFLIFFSSFLAVFSSSSSPL